MISFFRRTLSSKVVLGLFALILVAFLITGVETKLGGIGGGGAQATGDTLATVGRRSIDSDELARRIDLQLQQLQADNPQLTRTAFVAAGGVERMLAEQVDTVAVDLFGERTGVTAGKRLVDGQIASIPAFAGPTGKFDEKTYHDTLASRQISEGLFRDDVRSSLLSRQLLSPVSGAVQAPAGLVLPYAALLMERRDGTVGFVPAAAMAQGDAPSDAEAQAFYKANAGRYALPERRSIRYALIGRDQLAQANAPTEAEIKRFYDANPKTYAARDVRTLTQVVFTGGDAQAQAQALADRVKGGAPFSGTVNSPAIPLGEKSRDEFAAITTAPAADAVFALPAGGTSVPLQTPFGWNVVHVEAARTIPGKSLAAVHAEIATSLAKQKVDEALAKLVGALNDEVSDGRTFDDEVKAHGLTAVTTPPLLASGAAPSQPGYQPSAEVPLLLKAAFQAEPNDPPSVETIGAGQRYALLKLDGVVAAAARPFPEVRDTVIADLQASRAASRAREVASAILTKVQGGTPMASAFAGAGVRLPPLQPVGGMRKDLGQPNAPGGAPLQALFALAPNGTRLIPAPGNGGWYVIHLDRVTRGDPRSAPGLIQQAAQQFGRLLGQEYAQQFAGAARAVVGTSRNDRAVAQLRARVGGAAPAQ